jgi:hypothetical protein
MAIGVIWSPPIDQQAHDATRERVMQASVDKGLKFHAGGEAEGRGEPSSAGIRAKRLRASCERICIVR